MVTIVIWQKINFYNSTSGDVDQIHTYVKYTNQLRDILQILLFRFRYRTKTNEEIKEVSIN